MTLPLFAHRYLYACSSSSDDECDIIITRKTVQVNYCTDVFICCCSWKGCELEHFCYNVETCWYLPQEETNIDGIESNMEASGGVITLLHGGHEGSSHCPEHHHTSSCIQVWSWEELSSSKECIARTSNGHQHPKSEDERSPAVVLVVQFLSNQILSLLHHTHVHPRV